MEWVTVEKLKYLEEAYAQLVTRVKNFHKEYTLTRLGNALILKSAEYTIIASCMNLRFLQPRFRPLFRVKTYLKHPRLGDTFLMRERVTMNELFWIIHYPRVHTTKGKKLVLR